MFFYFLVSLDKISVMKKLLSDGNNLVSKHYSGINGKHVEKINDNEFVITGVEDSNLIIFKINSEGELIQ